MVGRRPGRARRVKSQETARIPSTLNQWQHAAYQLGNMFAPFESHEEVQEAAKVPGNSETRRENGDFPSTQEVLNLIMVSYFKNNDQSKPGFFNGFIEYMEKVRKVCIVSVTSGSIIVTVQCGSLDILEGLWEDYIRGRLNEMAERYLVTEEILKAFGLADVKLTTTIKKEEYEACRDLLIAGMFMVSLVLRVYWERY